MPPEKNGVSSRGPWRKIFIVVEYESGQYPKQILLSNMKDAERFATLRIGMTGTFKYDCSVRNSNGNYFMDVNCWSWQIDQPQQSQAPAAPPRGDEPF